MTHPPSPHAIANQPRFDPNDDAPCFEAWILRAHHPHEPRSVWIRYAVHAPGVFDERIGELRAVVFDGTTGLHRAVRSEVPLARVALGASGLHVTIGEASLEDGRAHGHTHHGPSSIRWHLTWDGGHAPLSLLSPRLEHAPVPRMKAVSARPLVTFRGTLELDGHALHVDGWQGSQAHRWGHRHADAHAWGEVAGFDDAPDVFLEAASAQLAFGPTHTPALSVLVLREGERETLLHGVATALRSRARFAPFSWELVCRGRDVRVTARLEAPRERFVALREPEPEADREVKIALLSQLATCTLEIERRGEPTRTYETRNRAALELLGASDGGLPVLG
ncbi:MAG: hypothetical protein K1X94_28775 [Sandaracinaceae bacterium]|nr:hypothetical protein [Sandaracinaceae bacterium]